MTRQRLEVITTIKHPVMRGREDEVRQTLHDSDEIRRSHGDPDVYLLYRLERPGRWLCAVVKQLDDNGFVITSYPTDAIKAGEQVWSR